MAIHLKRIYEDPEPGDGTRVLVDRLWPRGVRKDEARLDLWMKNVAPSDALRKEYHHDQERWDEFRTLYRRELEVLPDALQKLRAMAEEGEVTLLYASRDEERNNAVVLKEVLEEEAGGM